MIESCRNCVHLTYCEIIDENKLLDRFRCEAYEQAPVTEIAANVSVIKLFGAWALGYDNQLLQDRKNKEFETARRKQRRRHRNG